MLCVRCNQETGSAELNVCQTCRDAEKNRKALQKKSANNDWLVIAEENEIPLYVQQPEELDDEYMLWLSFRDMYPHKKPTIRGASDACQVSYSRAKEIAAKWDWPIRLQAWGKHCNELAQQARAKKIVDMNTTHISMAQTLQNKLKTAIDNIDPYSLSPKDINSLMKTAAEIERKAFYDDTEEWKPETSTVANKELKESTTKKEDLSEVMGILMSAGLLQGKKVGVEQTTRVIVDGE